MKSGSIFRILNARSIELIPPNHQHLPQDQIASDERRCCAFGGIKRVSSTTSLKPGEIVNAHRYHQQLIKLHYALRKKRPHYQKRQADFLQQQRTIAHVNNTTWRHSTGKLNVSIPSRLFTRPGTF